MTSDSLAYDYYLLAQHHWNRFTEPDLRQSLAYSDSAIARDPAFVDAWLARANALLSLASGNGSMTVREALGPLRQAVDTILALDPRSGQAHSIRGLTYTWFERGLAAADREFRQSFAARPAQCAWRTPGRRSSQVLQGHTDSAAALLAHRAGHRAHQRSRRRGRRGSPAYYGRRYDRRTGRAAGARCCSTPISRPPCSSRRWRSARLGRHDEADRGGPPRGQASGPAPAVDPRDRPGPGGQPGCRA